MTFISFKFIYFIMIFNDDVMLAHSYFNSNNKPIVDPTGWYASIKYDGVRGIWTGEKLITRSGNPIINVPKWFLNALPLNISIEGELYIGKKSFDKTGIFRQRVAREIDEVTWKQTRFMLFDMPVLTNDSSTYIERDTQLKTIVEQIRADWNHDFECPFTYIEKTIIKDAKHLNNMFTNAINDDEEGLVIMKPDSRYINNRSNSFLKVKKAMDSEAVIYNYNKGNGRNADRLGSFAVYPLIDGVENKSKAFKVGGGLSDKIRNSYKTSHPVGTIITYKHDGYTKNGKPRFPRYLRIRPKE